MEKIPEQPTPEEKNKDEEAALMSRRSFLKKAAIAGGVLATGGLTKLVVDGVERVGKAERENTRIGTGTIIKKEVASGGPTITHYFLHVRVGEYEGRVAVFTRLAYDSYKEGENVVVEYKTYGNSKSENPLKNVGMHLLEK